MSADMRNAAEEASRILQSDVFQGAFERLDTHIVEQWRHELDPRKRDELYWKQAVLADVRASLVEHINLAAERESRENGKPGYWRALWEKLK